jgi:sugar phosphate isomerase/epimerase
MVNMKGLQAALQLFSVRDELQENFYDTLKRVKDFGYDGVEFAGLFDHDPKEVKKFLASTGLVPVSAHVPYQEMRLRLTETIKQYATLGCSYIAIPYLAEEERYGTDAYKIFLQSIPKISEECSKFGITLLYHNHNFEFEKDEENQYVLDSLYSTYDSTILKTELDTCWVKIAGEDPVKYIKKYSGRCPVVHIKDYKSKNPVVFAAVGTGLQNVFEIIKACYEAGTEWVVVEQDSHTENNAMEDAKISLEYLKTVL